MRFPTTTAILIVATLPWLAGCEADVEAPGQMRKVDVDGNAGNFPEYDATTTRERETPSVDVDAEQGRLPEADVRGPDGDVGMRPATMPDVEVDLPEGTDEAGSNQMR